MRADGTPVPGATVGILASSDSTVTSDSGRFALHSVTPGAHMLWVHGVGFEPVRVAVTVSPERSRTVTVTVARSVPVLAPILTTARYQSAYAAVGLDKRMRAGLGQFITLDQIEKRHALKITDLLQQIRGIHLYTYGIVDIGDSRVTASQGSCVAFVLDGIPQKSYTSHDLGTLVDVAEIGAIEYYNAAEVPGVWAGAGTGVTPAPGEEDLKGQATPSGANGGLVGSGRTCSVMAIWTRSRLGLSGYAADSGSVASSSPAATPVSATRVSKTVGNAVFPAGSGPSDACVPPTPLDTITLNVYAVLQSGLAPDARDPAWIGYASDVFAAFRRALVLPSPLALPVFGYATPAITRTDLNGRGLAVAPTLTTVVAFSLGPSGAVLESAVAASSLAGSADTGILAAIQGAGSARAFPRMPASSSPRESIRFDVVVTTIPPDSTQHAVVVDQIRVPEWPLARAVGTAPGVQPIFPSTRTGAASRPDSATFEFVVDESGKVNLSTGRAISTAGRVGDPAYLDFVARIAQILPALRYAPARVGTCPVAQVTQQAFSD